LKILVTGGAGYIGSVVVADLIGAGREVVVYDNLSSGHVYAVPKGTMLVRGDLSNRGLLKSALAEHHIDGVMHFAASSVAAESMKMPGPKRTERQKKDASFTYTRLQMTKAWTLATGPTQSSSVAWRSNLQRGSGDRAAF